MKLNQTNVTVLIQNQDGSPIDNITVTLESFQNDTQNGSVFFNKVPGGYHNITFSGNLSKIYGMGSQTVQIYVTPGENNTYQYTFNETQFLVTVQNESSSGLPGLTVYLTNENNSYSNTTNSSGQVLFRQVSYGNYTISFNYTQLSSLGYQNKTENVEVLLGENPSTGNNKTITLQDVEVWFNITNSSGSLQNINVSLLSGGSTAQNGYGKYLTNLTNSSGLAILHNVIPQSYTYKIDGNSSGYGIYTDSVAVQPTGSNITKSVVPLSLNVTVKDQNSQPLVANVTLYQNSQIAQNVKGQALSSNSTGGTSTFTYLYAGNYTVSVTKDDYSSYSQLHSFIYGLNSLTVTLSQGGFTTTTTSSRKIYTILVHIP